MLFQRRWYAIFHPSMQESMTFLTRPVSRTSKLLLPRLLRIAAHNLDLLRRDIILIVELEIDVLDKKRPDFVAETVGIQMALFAFSLLAMNPLTQKAARRCYLEVHARLDLICQHLGD